MKLVPSDEPSQEEVEIQAILKEHPVMAAHLTLLLNGFHELTRSCALDNPDPSDVLRSLAKKEGMMQRMGIPLLHNLEDWARVRAQCEDQEG